MSLSVRGLALECVSHLGEEISLAGDMPSGSLDTLSNVINAALEEMRTEGPAIFRQTIGIQWTAAASGTVNVTHGSPSLTLGTLVAPADGCTVNVTGDASLNEIRAEPTQAGVFLLLHPYTGTSGTVSCAAYGDSVELEEPIDRVLGALLLHERRPLQVLSSRSEWMQWQGATGWRDYGFSENRDTQRTPGEPRAVWVESFVDATGGPIVYRARCAPLPNGNFRATMEVLVRVTPITQDDWAPGADVFLPVPGGRDFTILRPMVLQKWSGTSWFANDKARPQIAAEYAAALAQLRTFRANASAPVRLVMRP